MVMAWTAYILRSRNVPVDMPNESCSCSMMVLHWVPSGICIVISEEAGPAGGDLQNSVLQVAPLLGIPLEHWNVVVRVLPRKRSTLSTIA